MGAEQKPRRPPRNADELIGALERPSRDPVRRAGERMARPRRRWPAWGPRAGTLPRPPHGAPAAGSPCPGRHRSAGWSSAAPKDLRTRTGKRRRRWPWVLLVLALLLLGGGGVAAVFAHASTDKDRGPNRDRRAVERRSDDASERRLQGAGRLTERAASPSDRHRRDPERGRQGKAGLDRLSRRVEWTRRRPGPRRWSAKRCPRLRGDPDREPEGRPDRSISLEPTIAPGQRDHDQPAAGQSRGAPR